MLGSGFSCRPTKNNATAQTRRWRAVQVDQPGPPRARVVDAMLSHDTVASRNAGNIYGCLHRESTDVPSGPRAARPVQPGGPAGSSSAVINTADGRSDEDEKLILQLNGHGQLTVSCRLLEGHKGSPGVAITVGGVRDLAAGPDPVRGDRSTDGEPSHPEIFPQKVTCLEI